MISDPRAFWISVEDSEREKETLMWICLKRKKDLNKVLLLKQTSSV